MNFGYLNSKTLKAEALRLGFSACGLAPAAKVDAEHAERFLSWLSLGYQAEMRYMERHVDLRLDPRLLVPGAQTVLSLAMCYRPSRQNMALAMYAQGTDYHEVLRSRMHSFMNSMGLKGRCFVDTAPVLERYWAWKAGLGWIGPNAQFYVPGIGSTVFLCELILIGEADSYDTPLLSSCTSCGTCTSSCPQGAISSGGVDARKCLSYLTIEHRGEWPESLRLKGCFYGCDCCQSTCPLQYPQVRGNAVFEPNESLLAMSQRDWCCLSPDQFNQLFGHSAVQRVGYRGLMRCIEHTELSCQ